MTDQIQDDVTTYCEVHPDKETALRCNKCGRYMCTACAVPTPVGYRCRECVRQVEDKFYNATPNDLMVLFAACLGMGAALGVIFGFIRLPLILLLLLGLPLGGVLAELPLRLVQRRRGRNSPQLGAGGIIIGGLLGSALQFSLRYMDSYNSFASRFGETAAQQRFAPFSLDLIFSGVFSNLGLLILIGIVAVAVYGRMRMR